MSLFVASPNLPISARHVLIGEKRSDILQFPLESVGIISIFVPDNPQVDPRLSGHADLSVFHLGGERLLLAEYLRGTEFAEKLREHGAALIFSTARQGREYPNDAQLNACAVGSTLLYASKVTDSYIVNSFTNKFSCRQGYTKCSVCVVDEQSVITADQGIAIAAERAGIQVLRITPGHVALPGYPYGFLGGAAFKLSAHCMAFTGVLDGHPDQVAILDFLAARSIAPVFLTKQPIFDIGGGIPLTETAGAP